MHTRTPDLLARFYGRLDAFYRRVLIALAISMHFLLNAEVASQAATCNIVLLTLALMKNGSHSRGKSDSLTAYWSDIGHTKVAKF